MALARGRGRRGRRAQSLLGQYVNDRPYAASSMLAVALGKAFRTALAGRCDARPELVDVPLDLEVHVPAVPCDGDPAWCDGLFEPLGWDVTADARAARRDRAGVGRLALRRPQAHRPAGAQPGAVAPLRAAARARRRQALLGQRRRGRQARPRRRRLAGRPPGARDGPAPRAGRPAPPRRRRGRAADRARRPAAGRARGRRRADGDPRPLVALRREAVVAGPARSRGTPRRRPRLRRGRAAARPARRPVVHRDPRRRRLGPCPRGRRAAAAPRDHARAPARADRAGPVVAHLPRPAPGRLGRPRADGGRRARRPGPAARARGRRLRRRPAAAGRGDHPERRAQRPLRRPGCRRDAAPRPPVRVDAGRAARVGRAVAARHGYAVRYAPIGADDPEVGPPTQLAVFTRKEAG